MLIFAIMIFSLLLIFGISAEDNKYNDFEKLELTEVNVDYSDSRIRYSMGVPETYGYAAIADA